MDGTSALRATSSSLAKIGPGIATAAYALWHNTHLRKAVIEGLPLAGRAAQALASFMPEKDAWLYLLCRAVGYGLQDMDQCHADRPQLKQAAIAVAAVDIVGVTLMLVLSELIRRLHKESLAQNNNSSAMWLHIMCGIFAGTSVIFVQAFNGIADAMIVFGGNYVAAMVLASFIATCAGISGGRYAGGRSYDLEGKPWWPETCQRRLAFTALFLLGTAMQMLTNFYQARHLLTYGGASSQASFYGGLSVMTISLINNTLVQGKALGCSWTEPDAIKNKESFYGKFWRHRDVRANLTAVGIGILEVLNAVSALAFAAILFETAGTLTNEATRNSDVFFYTMMTLGVLFGLYFAWLNKIMRLDPMKERIAILFCQDPFLNQNLEELPLLELRPLRH